MTYNTLSPDQRAQNLISAFAQAGGPYQWAQSSAEIFVNVMLSMLPETVENEKQIAYWNDVLTLIKYY